MRVVERHSRWLALFPFGVGQFQNRQVPLGISLLTGESLLAAGSAIGFALGLYNESLGYDALQKRTGTAPQYAERAQEAAIVGNIFAAGFAAVVLGGIVQAQIAFVPEQVHIERHIPPLPQVSIAPLIRLDAIGITGTF